MFATSRPLRNGGYHDEAVKNMKRAVMPDGTGKRHEIGVSSWAENGETGPRVLGQLLT
jgi:hypothetical protein